VEDVALLVQPRPRDLAGTDPTLSPDQLVALREAVRTRMNYPHGVRARMYQLGATGGDPLFDPFGEAGRALQRPSDELHSRSISGPRRPWGPGGRSEPAHCRIL